MTEIKRKRMEEGKSVNEFAKACGWSTAFYSKLASGRQAKVGDTGLRKLMHARNLTYEQALAFCGQSSPAERRAAARANHDQIDTNTGAQTALANEAS